MQQIVSANPFYLRYVQGLGIAGTSSFSSSYRLDGLNKAIELFLDSPIWGYSLGGNPQNVYEAGSTTFTYGSAMSIIGVVIFLSLFRKEEGDF